MTLQAFGSAARDLGRIDIGPPHHRMAPIRRPGSVGRCRAGAGTAGQCVIATASSGADGSLPLRITSPAMMPPAAKTADATQNAVV